MTIGKIQFYGLRSVTEDQVRALLPFSEGFVVSAEDPLSEEDMELQLAEGLRISRTDLSLVCCYEPYKAIAYVGVDEGKTEPLQFRDEPTGDTTLPAEIVETQRQIDTALRAAVLSGDAGDDISQGHSLATNAQVRALQEKNVDFAIEYYDILVEVLHESALHRELAAIVIGYAPDKKAVVPHLQAAALDPDEEVRNNATRALYAIAAYSSRNPELEIEIDGAIYVDMLNSVWFADRNKSAAMLGHLTESRNPALMQSIRDKAIPSLIEMCRWDVEGHRYMPCRILERAIGLPEQDELHPTDLTIEAAQEILRTRSQR